MREDKDMVARDSTRAIKIRQKWKQKKNEERQGKRKQAGEGRGRVVACIEIRQLKERLEWCRLRTIEFPNGVSYFE